METAVEWDRRLDKAIQRAVVEARVKDNPALADMLAEFRVAMGAWKDISMSRLRMLGVFSLTQQEHERVLQLIADATAAKVVEAAQLQIQQQRDAWWQRRSVRVGVVVAMLSVILSTAGTMIALIALVLKH